MLASLRRILLKRPLRVEAVPEDDALIEFYKKNDFKEAKRFHGDALLFLDL